MVMIIQTGITNKIQTKLDNIYMTDRQIEQMAIRVADIVIQALEGKQQEWDKALVADLQEFKSPIDCLLYTSDAATICSV